MVKRYGSRDEQLERIASLLPGCFGHFRAILTRHSR